MAYMLKFSDQDTMRLFFQRFNQLLESDGRFVIRTILEPKQTWEGIGGKRAANRGAPAHWQVGMRGIRLTRAKPYCGQHPGECIVGLLGPRPKPNLRCLEWDDWIQFHDLVNDVLDSLDARADVWTVPRELPIPGHGRRFFIRKGSKRRVRWEWEEKSGRFNVVRLWNMGSDDQFEK